MKIQLDTNKKTIKIEEDVKLSLLVETLDALLPGKKWEAYTLETNVTINNFNPIVIKDRYIEPYPVWPRPWIHWADNNYHAKDAGYEVKDGVFDLEFNNLKALGKNI